MQLFRVFQAAAMLVSGFSAWAEDSLVLTFTGDLMAHEKNQSMGDYNDIYGALAPWLLTDDFSFINLETPVDAERKTSSYPQFNAKPAYVEAAVRGGFQVFSLANNHSNDHGESSIDGTLKTMKTSFAEGVWWSGLREKESDPIAPVVLEKAGWRIGFVALTNLLNRWPGHKRVNHVHVWDVWSKKDAPKAQEALLKDIARWKEGVDLLVVSFHDGVEYSSTPDPLQIAFFRRMAEAGADVLWGHHPHVLQPWEWVETGRGPRLVLYSLGNFVSRQSAALGPKDGAKPAARTGDGALMRVIPSRTAEGIRLTAEAIPLNNYHDPDKGTVVVPTEILVRNAPEPWRDYYSVRWAVQQAWASPGD